MAQDDLDARRANGEPEPGAKRTYPKPEKPVDSDKATGV